MGLGVRLQGVALFVGEDDCQIERGVGFLGPVACVGWDLDTKRFARGEGERFGRNVGGHGARGLATCQNDQTDEPNGQIGY